MTKPQAVLTLSSFRGEQGREKDVCKVGRIIRTLDAEDQATVNLALSGSEGEFPSSRIESALGEVGLYVGNDAITRHRRGSCACNPSRR